MELEALARLPLVGGMSSIPSRAAVLPGVLERIMPQVDRLHLFLHGHDAVPAGVARPNLIVTTGPRDHPYRASGKFLGLTAEAGPCMYFGFDDDLIYTDGHVDRLRAALLRYGGKAVVGLHGVAFRSDAKSFFDGKRFDFWRRLRLDRAVDMLGVGTCAFVSTSVSIDPPSWPYGDMDDLMLAVDLERQGVPLICVARPRSTLIVVNGSQTESLWAGVKRDSSRQDAEMAKLLDRKASKA